MTILSANASELTLEELRSDFHETINHYSYELEPQDDSPTISETTTSAPSDIAENETEILDLESQYFDTVNTSASGIQKNTNKRVRSR